MVARPARRSFNSRLLWASSCFSRPGPRRMLEKASPIALTSVGSTWRHGPRHYSKSSWTQRTLGRSRPTSFLQSSCGLTGSSKRRGTPGRLVTRRTGRAGAVGPDDGGIAVAYVICEPATPRKTRGDRGKSHPLADGSDAICKATHLIPESRKTRKHRDRSSRGELCSTAIENPNAPRRPRGGDKNDLIRGSRSPQVESVCFGLWEAEASRDEDLPGIEGQDDDRCQ